MLERGRRERVVDDDQGPRPAALVGPSRDRRHGRHDVDDLQVRVGRRLEPDQPRSLGECLPERVLVRGEVDVPGIHAGAAADPLEVAERAAVDVVTDDDLVARSGELSDGRGGGGTRGERDAVRPTLESRDGPLQSFARRVL
jgi:hypothetical protein